MIVDKKEGWYEKLFALFGAYDLVLTQTEISDIIHKVHEVSEKRDETAITNEERE